MRIRSVAFTVVACLMLSSCASLEKAGKVDDKLSLQLTTFDSLPGWQADAQAETVVALQRSCVRILNKDPDADFGVGGFAGKAADWQSICNDLNDAIPMTDAEARDFFEERFTPYVMSGNKGTEGLFTGYYEPLLHGSKKKKKPYIFPIYGRPDDLVSVSLGDFRPDLKGEMIKGRVKGEKLVPYYKRAEIEDGALKKQKKEIIWVDSAVDAFFLHIQGSGLVKMRDGSIIRVGYADQNGQPYLAVGKALLDKGALEKGNVSMQSIRAWLEQNPEEAAEVMNLNNSYVFFRKLTDKRGPLGAEGVPLMPKRSMAVDRKKIPYGVPIWIDAEEPEGEGRLQRLMMAQDTGGAIVGAVRGDFFWGADEEAGHKAGLMKSRGRAWMLLPKTTTADAPKAAPFTLFDDAAAGIKKLFSGIKAN